ncbi:MAG: hypothetical protein CMO64_05155 [Verrucomicrobiales bacterium]|nr:hypothetical protein [Verrucomicrobiales bacterium]|tara:strand:+ start:1763 stop:2341 length:579 start_codon:yes stop_codon:yes gene_type:complete
MDCFALLDEPRRPWLDTAALKEKYLSLAAATHPDQMADAAEKEAAQKRFAEFNNAHDTLRDTRRRLAHLLTLERGEKPPEVHDIPPETAELFLEVGALLKPVGEFIQKQEAQTSPIVKARALPRALELLDQVTALQQSITTKLTALDTQLQSLNDRWGTAESLNEAEQLWHQASYLNRWREQLQDHAFRLTP